MKIVTFANFDFSDSRYLVMALMWIKSVTDNYRGKIEIWSKTPVQDLFSPHTSLPPNLKFIVEPKGFEGDIFLHKFKIEKWKGDHNIRYKMFHLSHIQEPFFYLDLDLVLLSDPNIFFQQHPNIEIVFPNRNGGVFLVNKPSIMDWSRFLSLCQDPTFNPALQKPYGSDQAIMYHCFRGKHYAHQPEWNAYSEDVIIAKRQGAWKAWFPTFLQRAHIVHYYTEHSKPWQMGCPIYQETLQKVSPNHST